MTMDYESATRYSRLRCWRAADEWGVSASTPPEIDEMALLCSSPESCDSEAADCAMVVGFVSVVVVWRWRGVEVDEWKLG